MAIYDTGIIRLPNDELDEIAAIARAEEDIPTRILFARLVMEVRRQRRLLQAAAAFVVPSDGYCPGCARTVNFGHAADCIVGEIQDEAVRIP